MPRFVRLQIGQPLWLATVPSLSYPIPIWASSCRAVHLRAPLSLRSPPIHRNPRLPCQFVLHASRMERSTQSPTVCSDVTIALSTPEEPLLAPIGVNLAAAIAGGRAGRSSPFAPRKDAPPLVPRRHRIAPATGPQPAPTSRLFAERKATIRRAVLRSASDRSKPLRGPLESFAR